MDSIKDLLNQKADNLDTSAVDELAMVQSELDKQFQGKVKALMITDHDILHLTVGESGLASELRLSQVEIQEAIEKIIDRKLKSLRISIR